jgi:hypothetical protein
MKRNASTLMQVDRDRAGTLAGADVRHRRDRPIDVMGVRKRRVRPSPRDGPASEHGQDREGVGENPYCERLSDRLPGEQVLGQNSKIYGSERCATVDKRIGPSGGRDCFNPNIAHQRLRSLKPVFRAKAARS